jgi:hypothetical protein
MTLFPSASTALASDASYMRHPAPGLSSPGSEEALLLSRDWQVAELPIHRWKKLLNLPRSMARIVLIESLQVCVA